MSSQAEENYMSQTEGQNGDVNPDAVRTRVSELLDNATVTPDDPMLEHMAAGNAASKDISGKDGISEVSKLEAGKHAETVAEEATGKAVATDSESSELENSQPEDVASADVTLEPDTPDANSAHTQGEVEPDEPEQDALVSAEDLTADASSADDADHADDTDGPQEEITPTAVRIRGQPGGISVEIDEEGDWTVILKLLEARLAAAEGFFRGGRAVLEVGPRDVYENELRKARELLARHDMTLAVVRSTSDLTLQSSLLLGLSTSNNAAKPVEPDRGMAPVVPITQPKSPYFVHNGTLRSGQILRKAESIVVVGDVNPGAKVISGGDVMVWGRLRGMAYAGAGGSTRALVAAIEFSPTQLRIAGVTAVAPDAPKASRGFRFWKKEPERRAEVAYIVDGRIVVEPWDDSRPGRPKIARR